MAQVIQDVRNISFRSEVTIPRGARKGRIRPDAEGYYPGVPMAVLGTVSQNKTYYDINSIQEQLTNPDTGIKKMLSQGKLYGEYGHPDLNSKDYDNTEEGRARAIVRIATILEKNHSHHFRSIYTGRDLEDGGKLLVADIKPHGPYSATLRDNLDDPCVATSFSLRSITANEARAGYSYRVMKKLVTFDYVGAGGYAEACKYYSPGCEGFAIIDVGIVPGTRIAVVHEVGMECFTDTEMNDIFGAMEVQKISTTTTYLQDTSEEGSRAKFSERGIKSMYHMVMGR